MFQLLAKKPSCQRLNLRVYMSSRESSGRKHHTLLYEDKRRMPNWNSPANYNNVNTVQTAPTKLNKHWWKPRNTLSIVANKTQNPSSENSHVFSQVQPVKISNENKLKKTHDFWKICLITLRCRICVIMQWWITSFLCILSFFGL